MQLLVYIFEFQIRFLADFRFIFSKDFRISNRFFPDLIWFSQPQKFHFGEKNRNLLMIILTNRGLKWIMTQLSGIKCVMRLCRISVSSTVSSRVSSKCVKTSTKINKLDKCRINNTKLLSCVVKLCHDRALGLCHDRSQLCHPSVPSKCVVSHDTVQKRGYMPRPLQVQEGLKKSIYWFFLQFRSRYWLKNEKSWILV